MLGVESALPMTGSGLFFASLGLYLLFSGGLGELINRTGTSAIVKFPLLTAVEITPTGRVEPLPAKKGNVQDE
jgi:hypothetical protein